ncbi:unnamed protein product [Pseudo-nitzschia multistriata]|uniref:Peptidase A1 domain-containing protein n=1 Tax=Pseudo-nitzschia multistriata TaxID=183589 RepID=A0A448ZKL2_9STRA|nr:unnamed protein product [Pseudo-nitzschia multistriata]
MKAVCSHFTVPALLFFLGACAGENPVQASIDAEQSPRLLLSGSSGNDPHVCFASYGDGAAFNLGFVGQDQLSFGGATGTTPVCLMEIESTPITNSIDMTQSPSLGDGLIGLQPACVFDGSIMTCNNNETDVISSLVKSGAISSFQFTMCFEENGGNLYLGPGQYPESTKWFPAVPFEATFSGGNSGSFWTIQGPSDGSSVGILARGPDGNETSVGEITSAEFTNTSYIDSGTSGVVFPQKYNFTILNEIANAWADDEDATEILGCSSVDSILELLADDYIYLSKEEADHLNSLVPDIIYRGFDGGDLVSDGSFYLYETYPSSGAYTGSWLFGPSSITLGTGFLLDKTVVFDNSDPSAPRIGIVSEEGGDCDENDYSEKGNIVKMSAPGGLSNVLGAGTYLGEIEFGGQKQLVQLDTGSYLFVLPNKPSCMQMDETAGECLVVESESEGSVIAYVNKDDDNCSKYAPLIDKYNFKNTCDNDVDDDCQAGESYFGTVVDFLQILMEIQPFAECEAQRAFCGDLKEYRKDLSSSFQYLPIGSDLTLGEWEKPPEQFSLSLVNGTCSMTGVPGDMGGSTSGESDHASEEMSTADHEAADKATDKEMSDGISGAGLAAPSLLFSLLSSFVLFLSAVVV